MTTRGKIRFEASDIWQAPDDSKIYEVVDGELFVTPPPSFEHQNAVSTLLIIVGNVVRERKLGRIVSAPVGVVLHGFTGVQPDIVFISREREHLISRRGVEGAPDLVVEALSPSTARRDRTIKMRAYAAAGVPHYWMLNPHRRALEAYRLGEEGYELVGEFGPGMVFRPELFPGLEIAIDELWE
jgi:Uma2 family endonuclease